MPELVKALFEKAQGSPRSIIRSKTRQAVPRSLRDRSCARWPSLGVGVYRDDGRRAENRWHERVASFVVCGPTGEADDWSKLTTPIVSATIPGSVHCFSMIDDRTAQVVIWGARRAGDVDVVSGARSPSPLVVRDIPGGCPAALARTANDVTVSARTTAAGASEIGSPTTPDGSSSKAVTPGASRVAGKRRGVSVQHLDPSHAAVFSLPTMSFDAAAGSGPRWSPGDCVKGREQRADLIAAAPVRGRQQPRRPSQSTKAGRSLTAPTFMILRRLHISVRSRRRQTVLLPIRPIAGRASTLDAGRAGARQHLTQLGRYPGLRDCSAVPKTRTGTLVALARHRSSDVWLYGWSAASEG